MYPTESGQKPPGVFGRARLATVRPEAFVVFGLWGVAAVLAAGALLAAYAT